MKPQADKVVKTDKADKKGRVARSVGAVIAGAAIGYVAGALTAPATGRETRRRIEEKAQGMARKAKRSLATAKDEAKDLGRKAKKSLTSAKDKLADKLHS